MPEPATSFERTGTYSCLEVTAQGDIRFQFSHTPLEEYRGHIFEHRGRSMEVDRREYPAMVRIHDINCRIYASLIIPSLPGDPEDRTPAMHLDHDTLLDRASAIRGWDLDFYRVGGYHQNKHQHGRVSSNVTDHGFLTRRQEIANIPELAQMILDTSASFKVHALELGLEIGAVAAIAAGLVQFGAPSLGYAALAGAALGTCHLGRRRRRDHLVDKLTRSGDIIEEMRIIQDIHERQRSDPRSPAEQKRWVDIGLACQDLGWNLHQYRKGLQFCFEGQRDEVEETLEMMLGEKPPKRLKYEWETKREAEQREETREKMIMDAKLDPSCPACDEGFSDGSLKVQGPYQVDILGEPVTISRDYHQGCAEQALAQPAKSE